MYDPTDGCPDCGTLDSHHAEDCEHLARQARAAAEDAAAIAEDASPLAAEIDRHRHDVEWSSPAAVWGDR